MSLEVKKTNFAASGWSFEEIHPGSCWQVIATKDSRTIVSRSQDRDQAWESVFDRIQESNASSSYGNVR